jgi:replication-associated recombination protein RarA
MIEAMVGRKGKGKTLLTRNLIQQRKYDKVFILDYLGEYQYLATATVQVNTYRKEADLRPFCKNAWNNCSKQTKTLIVFDEIHQYGKNSFEISWLHRFSRHANLDIISCSHRFVDFPMALRSLVDVYHVFQITEPRDIKFLSQLVSPVFLHTVRNLEALQYVDLKL